jgi:Trypsin
MSRRSGYLAGAAGLRVLGVLGVLGVLAAVVVVAAAATIGVAGAGGTARPARAGVVDTGVVGARVVDARVVGARVVHAQAPDAGVVGARVVDARVVGVRAVGAGAVDAGASSPSAAVTDQVSWTAQRGALAHWTPARMAAATAASLPRGQVSTAFPAVTRGSTKPAESQAHAETTAPRGIPTAAPFAGSPTTGVLFYTTGGKGHFCTASVVDSSGDDLALTAAHCVYWKGFATNIAYVPGYHDGKRPYGAWAVRAITVASGWKVSHNPDLDFAFLTLASAGGRPIQARTGGLTIGFSRWYSEDKIEVIGHNDSGAEPIRCATKSFRFRPGQMEFYCHGFWTGTSGGPWIIGYNAKNGTGTVFGVIGGYELGGEYEWASYSAYFGSATRTLYQQVERQATPHPTPTSTPTPTPHPPPTATPPSIRPVDDVAPHNSYPTFPATATPGTAASATTSPPDATASPTGSISIAYQAPVVAD